MNPLTRWFQYFLIFAVLIALPCLLPAQSPVGAHGPVGTLANPKVVSRLEITKPGVYETMRWWFGGP